MGNVVEKLETRNELFQPAINRTFETAIKLQPDFVKMKIIVQATWSFSNRCDTGFAGDFCVSDTPLPMMLKDDFNSPKTKSSVWGEVYGGSNSQHCGALVTDKALTFNEVRSHRLLVSIFIECLLAKI